MRPIIFLATVFLPVALACAQPAMQIAPHELKDAHVQRAIEAIVGELANRMDDERFWEPESVPSGESSQPIGYTSLVANAMLMAGESYQGDRLRDAVKFLDSQDMTAVYGLGMRASLWAGLPSRFHRNLQADAQQLLRGFQAEQAGWYYHVTGPAIFFSNSRRMFGALGLWEAANRGVNVPRPVWQQLEQVFLNLQLADGGWNYRGDGPSTGSMTATGLATLFITQDHLHSDRFVNISPRRQAQEHPADLAIQRGLEWMDRHFIADDNPGMVVRNVRSRYFYYYLYSLERAALASGYKHFGGRDWFREGAAELIHRFCAWDEDSRRMVMHQRTYGDGRRAVLRTDDLAFGLMFLSRGRVPIAINKLRDESIAWNNRPRDVANFTAWLQEETASDLNWQIADFTADPESWLDAPLLYFASHQAAPWARRGSPQLDKIKRYLDLGGFMFAVSEGAGRQFAESIESAGRLMYPHLEWRNLEGDHWAYTAQYSVEGNRPRLRGLSNGVRDLIIVSSDDLAATFQARRTRLTTHYQTLANIYFYASEMNRPKPRLSAQTPEHLLDDVDPAPRESATMVRASLSGEHTHPEPLALEVFADALLRAGDLRLTIVDHSLEKVHEIAPKPHLIIVSGTTEHTFTDAEREAIKQFVEAGGVILFEQAGGNPKAGFAQSAETMAQQVFAQPIRPMRGHTILSGENIPHATDLSRVEYRPYSIQITGGIETTPRLRGVTDNSGGVVLISRDDLTNALLNQPSWGVHGYSPHAARLLLRNMLLYTAANQ